MENSIKLLFLKTMKNNVLYAFIFLLFGFAGVHMYEHGRIVSKEEENKIPLRDRIDLAWAQEFEMTKDPNTGDVPRDRLYKAWLYMKSLQTYGKAALSG